MQLNVYTCTEHSGSLSDCHIFFGTQAEILRVGNRTHTAFVRFAMRHKQAENRINISALRILPPGYFGTAWLTRERAPA